MNVPSHMLPHRTPAQLLAVSDRERDILDGFSRGLTYAQMGRALAVNTDTLKTNARYLFRKLGARNQAHAVALAFRAGVLT